MKNKLEKLDSLFKNRNDFKKLESSLSELSELILLKG